ncbi:15-hydroxyprostaglandin dehydrogenase [NAD(+)]-like [Ptychodera flava]|uniref:15-hydroxyprostaglandin dehydrogenase [NAD(+)]-like n=1 Tax=Ptychodera flava TaxID=63121 RepID=UPI00396A9E99
MNYRDKVALVTGAAEGIGLGIAEVLLNKGIKGVCLADINEKLTQTTAQRLQESNGHERVIFMKCDVTSPEQLKGVFQQTRERFGRLDIVCNNAGIVTEFEWQRMLLVNLNAVIQGTYLGVEHMGTQNGGHGGVVVNMSSTNGLKPSKFLPTYAASKHGVIGFSRSVAEEPNVLENHIRVVTVCPIMVMTSLERNVAAEGTRYGALMVEAKARRKNRPEASVADVANVVVRCIEDESSNGKVYLTLPGGDSIEMVFPDVNAILQSAIDSRSAVNDSTAQL